MTELFSGVPGYVVDCLCEIVKGKEGLSLLSEVLEELQKRIREVLANSRKTGGYSSENFFAETLINSMQSPVSRWSKIQDTGLCGRRPPAPIILRFILEWIFTYYDPTNIQATIDKVVKIRDCVRNDPGFDGCLLEYEMVLRLQLCRPFKFYRFELLDEAWYKDNEIFSLPSDSEWKKVFTYSEPKSLILFSSKNIGYVFLLFSLHCLEIGTLFYYLLDFLLLMLLLLI